MLGVELRNRIRQMNPWLSQPEKAGQFMARFIPKTYIPREAEETRARPDRAMLVIGPRQSGKSTMVWHRLLPISPHVLFLNMEDPLLNSALGSVMDLVEHLQEDYSFVKALFIDEIQHMNEAGLFLKGLVDSRLHVPIWVTGSASFHLRSKTRESLAGRASRQRLLPFSLRELLSHANPANPVAARQIAEKALVDLLVFGGYPAVYLEQDKDQKRMLLSDLVEALILRDASDLYRIKRVDAFRRLLTLLAGQVANLINLSELASICGVDVGTISAYVEILQESHVLKNLSPFAGGKRREITTAPKVFFIDNGIRNQLLNSYSQELALRTDRGQLLENWVFTEIWKVLPFQSTVKFWRSKSGAEVDFVIEHGQRLYGVEVKASALKQPKLGRPARSFIEAYRPDGFAVVNLELEHSSRMEHCDVSFIPPHALPEWLSSWMRTT